MRLLALFCVALLLALPVLAAALIARFTGTVLSAGRAAAFLGAMPVTEDPFVLGYRGDPARALGLDFEEVSISIPLGPAAAWYVPAASESPLAALYIHGIGGARENGYRHLSLLQAAGIPTLLISYRNDATAPAAPDGVHGFGLTEWPDVEAAVAWLGTRGHDRLLVAAESMGAGLLGQYLRQGALTERVAAIALDSPALSLRGTIAHVVAQYRAPLPGLLARLGIGFLSLRAPVDYRQAEVPEIFARFPGPLLLAHGSGDRIVPDTTSWAMLARRTGATVTLRGGADHLGTFAENPDRYRRAFAAFLALIPD